MIALDWPPSALSPNARIHYRAKARIVTSYRYAAFAAGINAGDLPPERPLSVTVEFSPPDARKRDLDNMLASIKAGLDGISDAYGLNDYDINPITIKRCDPVKGGRVIVRFS